MGKLGRDLVAELGIEALERAARIELQGAAEMCGLVDVEAVGAADAVGVFEVGVDWVVVLVEGS